MAYNTGNDVQRYGIHNIRNFGKYRNKYKLYTTSLFSVRPNFSMLLFARTLSVLTVPRLGPGRPTFYSHSLIPPSAPAQIQIAQYHSNGTPIIQYPGLLYHQPLVAHYLSLTRVEPYRFSRLLPSDIIASL